MLVLTSRVSAPSSIVTPLSSVAPPEGSIVVPDDFSTIQEAVDNAPEGGIVFVRSGSYRERVRVNKPLSLIGESPENTDISVSLPYRAYAAIEVQTEDVTISGFTIKNTYDGIWITEEYQMPLPSRCRIIGNNIVDNFFDGIFIEAGENHVISGNNITGNGDSGIYSSSTNIVISGNNITGNGGSENVTINNNNI